jgi:hypothetical protein
MDLSRLPEPLRTNLQKQLDAMPAEYRQKLEAQLGRLPIEQLTAVLSKNSALIEKLAGKSSGFGAKKPPPRPSSSSTAATAEHHKSGANVGGNLASTNRTFDPHDHYNATIGRGDMPSPPLLVLLVVFAGILALIWAFAGN